MQHQSNFTASRYLLQVSDAIAMSSVPWRLFGLYIFLLCVLPSGSIYGLNVKILCFLPLSLFGLVRLAYQSSATMQLAFACSVAVICILWTMGSLLNPFYAPSALSELKDVLTTFAGCLLVRLFTVTPEERTRFLRVSVFSVGFGSFLKVCLFSYAAFTGASLAAMLGRVSTAFGVQLMTVDLEGFGGRIQLPSDNLLPICIFLLLSLRRRLRLNLVTSFLLVNLLSVSSLYTFSRYIWASTLFAVILGLSLSYKDKLKWPLIGLWSGVTIYFLPNLILLLNLRFSSALASESDLVRVWQIASLKAFFWSAPIFGHGMGSFPLDNKRSLETPYAYEVQILALMGQFGLAGMSFLAMLFLNYFRKVFFFRAGHWRSQAAVLLLLLDFLGAGFFNPCLLVSFSAVIYGSLFVLALSNWDLIDTQPLNGSFEGLPESG